MAIRPIFLPQDKGVNTIDIEFEWFPGFSPAQKKKSIQSLHDNFIKFNSNKKILEISSKSEDSLGVSLSAFNLKFQLNNRTISFESLFQGSKVFEKGGPYFDIHLKSAKEAKRDERLKTSGEIIGFEYQNQRWSNEPKTYFYDWMYIKTVSESEDLLRQVVKYDAFTDIEFNPKKSVNCQAKAAALLVAVYKNGDLSSVLNDPTKLLSYYEMKETIMGLDTEEASEQISFFFD